MHTAGQMDTSSAFMVPRGYMTSGRRGRERKSAVGIYNRTSFGLNTFAKENLNHGCPLEPLMIRLPCELICKSDRSGFEGLLVAVYEMPPSGRFVSEAGLQGYSFSYLPLANKGEAHVTMPGIGLDHRLANRDNCLLLPPRVSLHSEWTNAGGRLVAFTLSPRFVEAVARQVGLPSPQPGAPATRSFSDRSEARSAGRAPGGRNRKPFPAWACLFRMARERPRDHCAESVAIKSASRRSHSLKYSPRNRIH